MNPLVKDEKSGFIESASRNAFTAEKKLELLQLAQEFVDKQEYPDLNWICRKLGINIRTFWRHYDADDNFKDAYDTIEEQIENILNRALIKNAQRANGVGAAAFWLKNRLSKRWSDDPRGSQSFVDVSALKKALERGNEVIEGEIIPKPVDPSTQIT